MIYKYDFSISGDSFFPDKIINKIQGDFIIDSYFKPTDKKFEDCLYEYGYGGMSFWHPKKYAVEFIKEYEKNFVEFIETNYQLFIDNKVDNLQIFIEIYYSGGQCNFEIFNKELLRKLTRFNISLPISVYMLGDRELQQWESEIELMWD